LGQKIGYPAYESSYCLFGFLKIFYAKQLIFAFTRFQNLAWLTSIYLFPTEVSGCTLHETGALISATVPSEVRSCAISPRPYARWNLILAHLQHSKFRARKHQHFWEEAERFWAYRSMALSEVIWFKCVLLCFVRIL